MFSASLALFCVSHTFLANIGLSETVFAFFWVGF
jgi:hypothetical protein